jgi:hypothetical protein
MPCDTISTVAVQWNMERTDLGLLTGALNELGLMANLAYDRKSVVFAGGTFRNGQFNFDSTWTNRVTAAQASEKVAEIKRAYSGQIIQSQAKKFGWGLKKIGPFKYEVTKR